MKVVYEVFIEDDNYDTPPTRIELIFSELTTLEEKILKLYQRNVNVWLKFFYNFTR